MSTAADLSQTRQPATGLGGRTKRRPQRYDDILLAAVDLFHVQGYHQTSLEEIGARIGITPPAIYRHFHNKQEILDTAAVWMANVLLERFDTAPELETAEAQLLVLVDNLIETAIELPTFFGVLNSELKYLSADSRDACLEIGDQYTRRWVAAMQVREPDRTPEELLARLAIVMQMAVHSGSLRPAVKYNKREMLERAVWGALELPLPPR